MASPIEADIDVQMADGHAVGGNTVLPSRPAESGDAGTPKASTTAAQAAVSAAVPTLKAPVPPKKSSPPAQPTKTTQTTQTTPSAPSAPSAPPVQKPPPTRVTSAIPAMFVPLTPDADLTQPFNPPCSRFEKAKAMLGTIEYYRDGIREGFMYLADMDRKYIVGAVAEREKAMAKAREEAKTAAEAAANAPPPTASISTKSRAAASAATTPTSATAPPTPTVNENLFVEDDETISPGEIDVMIATMRAPAVPGVDYNMAPNLDQRLPLRFPPEQGEIAGGRQEAVRQINEVVEQALLQMSGFDVHIGQLRSTWTATLEREQKLLDERFGSLPGDKEARAAAQAEMRSNKEGEGATEPAAAKETQDVAMNGT
ncbi:hypothetical protein Sste5346_000262 [Sporothrix stenoceras]|uniref:Uncharacterized protein n=1 Tax=Sporothrix stenoceras TaxID=5173 RepID=A0ABR3ZSG6_9PEZI